MEGEIELLEWEWCEPTLPSFLIIIYGNMYVAITINQEEQRYKNKQYKNKTVNKVQVSFNGGDIVQL